MAFDQTSWQQRLAEFTAGLPQSNRSVVSMGGRETGPPNKQVRRIEVNLGHICNNVCAFCVSGQVTQEGLARPLPFESVLKAMQRGRQQGAVEITFLGGEPTIQANFFDSLEAAFDLGYSQVILFTNLARGNDPTFMERVTAIGPCHWRVSVQGGDEETHDRVVGRPGAYDRIRKGLQWLTEHNQSISLNVCVTSENVHSLEGLYTFIHRYAIEQMHIDMVRPSSVGMRSQAYVEAQLPDYVEVATELRRLLDRVEQEKPQFELNIGNFPYCLLPKHAHKITYGGQETLTVTGRSDGGFGRVFNKYAYQNEGKRFVDDCGQCVFQGKCHGLPFEQLNRYGANYLRPVSVHDAIALRKKTREYLCFGKNNRARSSKRPLTPAMARVVRTIRVINQQAPFEGWTFSRYVLLPERDKAVLRMRNSTQYFDVVFSVSSYDVDFVPDAERTTHAMKRAVSHIKRCL